MRVLLLILALGLFQSCCTMMEVSDLNTSGVVTDLKPVTNRPDGTIMYTILVHPEEKFYIRLVTFEKFNIGDTVCVRSQSYKLTNPK